MSRFVNKDEYLKFIYAKKDEKIFKQTVIKKDQKNHEISIDERPPLTNEDQLDLEEDEIQDESQKVIYTC